jgi:DNA polymerase I-like protein with 3'-5' exonuclease and polymerase domains
MLIALDFESDAIEPRPKYPPRPVGLSVFPEKGSGEYLAWGHPEGNNCDEAVPVGLLRAAFANTYNEFVFHNAPFDCSIIEEKLDVQGPWDRVHDTMLMAFLLDPYGELSLKPLAERWLGEAPVERDVVRDWLVRHGVCHANSKDWGAHIGKAPAQIVGPYAIADTRKTLDLYRLFEGKLRAKGML